MKLEPALTATITLYPAEKGGREGPIFGERYGCPCKFDPKDFSGWDGWVLLDGASLAPGETKQFGMHFLTPEAGALFRKVSKFYLWEGRVIGEAVPNP